MIDPPTREALEKERRDLEARVEEARHGHRACRVLHSGCARRFCRARFRQSGRHADHDPRQRSRAGRRGPPRVRARRLAEPASADSRQVRAAAANWPTGSRAATIR